ncbi:DUF115 domain-containing protein [Alkalihalobacillus oceani]|nr:DUF115 domain-containing protein [Halalkalibacter oceani]
MMQVDNINFLRKYFPRVREQMRDQQAKKITVERISTRSGEDTLKVQNGGKEFFLHSKYNPTVEAEKLLETYEDVDQYDHIFFYGLGLGYHVEKMINQYPDLTFTLYEPITNIFSEFIKTQPLHKFSKQRVTSIHVESTLSQQRLDAELTKIINKKVLFVALPSYKKAFSKEYQSFVALFSEMLKQKKASFRTNYAYEKRWTLNSLMNFQSTLSTPNILHDVDHEFFKNKPALLVAAGPSLAEELDRIRYIKEHKLAYVIAVGSAINALINEGIKPDAVASYDPKGRNQKVFEKTIALGLDHEIPLIFGSSIGFEVLQVYNGHKLHMLTNQDTISPYFLKHKKSKKLTQLNDAASIAVVTLQLMDKLKFNPIILVGQNLSFRNNQRFSKGIQYDHISSEVTEQEKERLIEITSVDGETVQTNEMFLRMKKQLESYIPLITNAKKVVINTTQGGAHIEGTVFKSLEEVVANDFENEVVIDNWFKEITKQYDQQYVLEQKQRMDESVDELVLYVNQLIKGLNNLNWLIEENKIYQITEQMNQLDKTFQAMDLLDSYKVLIHPTVRVQHELTEKRLLLMHDEKEMLQKGKFVLAELSSYIEEIKKAIEIVVPVYDTVLKEVEKKLFNE